MTAIRCILVTPLLLLLWPWADLRWVDRFGSWLIEWADPAMRKET